MAIRYCTYFGVFHYLKDSPVYNTQVVIRRTAQLKWRGSRGDRKHMSGRWIHKTRTVEPSDNVWSCHFCLQWLCYVYTFVPSKFSSGSARIELITVNLRFEIMRLVCVKLLQRWVKIFTARQHAYAWISRYCLPILSVCPSVRPSVCLSNAGTASRWIDVSSYFSTACRIHRCSFLSPTAFHRHAQLSWDGLRRPQFFCGNCVRQNRLNWSDEMWYVDTRGTRACYWADTLTLMNQGSRATTSLKMWDLRRLNLVWYHMRRSSVFLVQRRRRPGHKMAEPGVRKMFLDPT